MVEVEIEVDGRAYRSLLQHLREGAAVLSDDGVVLDANAALAAALDRSVDRVVGRPLAALVGDESIAAVGRHDLQLELPDGSVRHLVLSVAPLDVDAGSSYLGLTVVDVSGDRVKAEIVGQLADKMADLRDKVAHDALTGLANRPMFMDRLRAAVAACAEGEVVAVLYCDLDRFKSVNDTHGHAAGDEVLRQAATRMQQTMRSFDTVARLGGDEFAIVARHLPDAEAADAVAARVVEAVGTVDPGVADPVPTTVSIGVAVAGPDEADAESLLRHADIAMYRSKQLGRNRFVSVRGGA